MSSRVSSWRRNSASRRSAISGSLARRAGFSEVSIKDGGPQFLPRRTRGGVGLRLPPEIRAEVRAVPRTPPQDAWGGERAIGDSRRPAWRGSAIEDAGALVP